MRRRFSARLLRTVAVCGVAGLSLSAKPRTVDGEDPIYLVLQDGHTSWAPYVAASANGQRLVSGALDGEVRVWHPQTGVILRAHRTSSRVNGLAYAADASRVAIATPAGVEIWDPEADEVVRKISAWNAIRVAFSPDGKTVAISDGHALRLNDVASGEALWRMSRDPGSTSRIASLAFSPNGKLLAAGETDQRIHVIETATGKATSASFSLPPRDLPSVAVAFSPDGSRLAAGGAAAVVRLVTLGTAKSRDVEAGGAVDALAFSPDGRVLAVGGYAGVSFVNPGDREDATHAKRETTTGQRVAGLAWLPDGTLFAAGEFSTLLRQSSSSGTWSELGIPTAGVIGLSLSADGQTMAALFLRRSREQLIEVWDLAQGRPVLSIPVEMKGRKAFDLSPDGKWLAIAGTEGSVELRAIPDGSRRRFPYLSRRFTDVTCIRFSPDGRWLGLAGTHPGENKASRSYKSIQVIDLQELSSGLTLGETGAMTALAFSPDGKRLLAGGPDRTVLWDLDRAQREPFAALAEGMVYAAPPLAFAYGGVAEDVAFSPDGKRVAIAPPRRKDGGDEPVVLDAASGAVLQKLLGSTLQEREGIPRTIQFSRDGRLVTLSGTSDVTVWSTETAEPRTIAYGGGLPVLAAAFTPDGRLFAGGANGELALRNLDAKADRVARILSGGSADDWIVLGDDLRYDGSPRGWNRVRWRAGASTPMAPEAFFGELFQPGLLGAIVSRKLRPLPPIDFTVDRRQPSVAVALESRERSLARVRLSVVEAAPDAKHPRGSGARDLRLFRNGRLVRAWRGSLLPPGESSFSVDVDVPLLPGGTELSAYAFNAFDVRSPSARLELDVDAAAEAPIARGAAEPALPAMRVLSVGVDRYQQAGLNLRYAVADAKVFASSVENAQRAAGAFGTIEVTSLHDAAATRERFLEALRTLESSRPADAIFVYFAGHGVAENPRFHLLTHDAAIRDGRVSGGVSDRDLAEAFERIDAGLIVLVVDACNSGQALESERGRIGPINSDGLAQLAYDKGIYVLAASQGYQAALERADLGHGILTWALINEGLERGLADRKPRNGLVEVAEWLDYAAERVPEIAQGRLESAGRGRVFIASQTKKKADVQRPRVFTPENHRSRFVVRPSLGRPSNVLALPRAPLPKGRADWRDRLPVPATARFDGALDYVAVIHTSRGDLRVLLDARAAPAAVTTFIDRAEVGFYDGMAFDEIVAGVAAWVESPVDTPRAGQLESSGLTHVRGTVSSSPSSPDRFQITFDLLPEADDERTIFGRVESGEALLALEALGSASGLPRADVWIESIDVETRPRAPAP